MLSRAFKFTRRWLAPVVLILSLLLLLLIQGVRQAVRLGVVPAWYTWGKHWGKPYVDAEYQLSCDGDEIHFWHNDVVESLMGPATAKINVDLKSVAFRDPRFPFKSDVFDIG
jgi:hypothetical protein